ncbi:MAG: ZPR1 zinc finger domain-containing protein [ANME-2 cluster archaeon]|nr:ZPR1 zinc finger domain-containing protein [ANME-2 cluster archaeon]
MNEDIEPILTRTTCPLCQGEIILTWYIDTIPFFGEIVINSAHCNCGFKYADTMVLNQREPVKYTLRVESLADLDARVVRSSSGTIRIPELGIDIEPGSASESFISNVEGVLCRVEEVLGMVSRWKDEPLQTTDRAHEVLHALDEVKRGERDITLIIEDPLGNSAIIAERAIKQELTPQEAENLKTGMIVLEKDDLPESLR